MKVIKLVNQREALQFSIQSNNIIGFISLAFVISVSSYILGILNKGYLLRIKVRKGAPNIKNINILIFRALCLLIMIVKYLIAPKGSILNASYSEIRTTSLAANSSGLATLDFFISCLILVLAIDCFSEINKSKRIEKSIWLLILIMVVVFLLEFFKGERTSIGLVFALAFLYISFKGPNQFNLRFKKISLPLIAVIFGAFTLSYIRENASSQQIDYANIEENNFNFYKVGTWTGALYSTIGLADSYHDNKENFSLKYGETYISYIPSMLPEIFSKNLGIERAIDTREGNPARWFEGEYTQGGVSIIVPAFMNFGVVGLILIPYSFAIFVRNTEEKYLMTKSFNSALLYGVVTVFILRWYWYGDIYIIRGLMIYFIILAITKIKLK
ncbi:O-antigen polymerase [Pontibacter burrus]|uniref:Oligosaccharide repeat unit polymerase n=1 Tax=Pontibacter burrus TaxID=2704466 RepID=A0A6B3LVY0_9BACT|nr:O-antigen polymerase [Pontibacter burrus]NEM97604.1 oligosaccharide repeat unit polymerase [Pontibacter burrus]